MPEKHSDTEQNTDGFIKNNKGELISVNQVLSDVLSLKQINPIKIREDAEVKNILHRLGRVQVIRKGLRNALFEAFLGHHPHRKPYEKHTDLIKDYIEVADLMGMNQDPEIKDLLTFCKVEFVNETPASPPKTVQKKSRDLPRRTLNQLDPKPYKPRELYPTRLGPFDPGPHNIGGPGDPRGLDPRGIDPRGPDPRGRR